MVTPLGVLHLDVMVNDAVSLKDKRRVIKSFRDRTRARHNVSVAEVDAQNSIRRAEIGRASCRERV